jgi:hypothetical protein
MSGDNSRNFNKQYIKHNPVEYKMYCEFDKWFKTDFPKKLEETFVLLKTPSEQKKSSKRR